MEKMRWGRSEEPLGLWRDPYYGGRVISADVVFSGWKSARDENISRVWVFLFFLRLGF
jgi:hypothetical protein